MKQFFENLPTKEDDFISPLMAHFKDYHLRHPNVQTPDKERLLCQCLKYQNLYRELSNLKSFFLGVKK